MDTCLILEVIAIIQMLAWQVGSLYNNEVIQSIVGVVSLSDHQIRLWIKLSLPYIQKVCCVCLGSEWTLTMSFNERFLSYQLG